MFALSFMALLVNAIILVVVVSAFFIYGRAYWAKMKNYLKFNSSELYVTQRDFVDLTYKRRDTDMFFLRRQLLGLIATTSFCNWGTMVIEYKYGHKLVFDITSNGNPKHYVNNVEKPLGLDPKAETEAFLNGLDYAIQLIESTKPKITKSDYLWGVVIFLFAFAQGAMIG